MAQSFQLATLFSQFQPSRRAVIATSASAAALVLAVAGVSVATARTEVTLEVDGVSLPVVTWEPTTAGVLQAAGVELGEHDLVQPALGSTLSSGDTVVLRTAHPYTVTVDGEQQTVWTTASAADTILVDAGQLGDEIVLAADRSQARGTLIPVVSRARTLKVDIAGEESVVNALPGLDARAILAREGIEVSPIDRVKVTSEGGDMAIEVTKVSRGTDVRTSTTPYTTVEQESGDYFAGEVKVATLGQEGSSHTKVWHETINGEDSNVVVLEEVVVSEPVQQVVLKGTKEVTPLALIKAGLDPKATLEQVTEANGSISTLYTAELGSISSSAEIQQILTESGDATAAAAAMAASVPLVYSGEDPRALAQPMVAARGWGDSEFQCLVTLWNRESGWNPYAMNTSSGAYGIPQALPGSKMASAGADWQTNPVTQITWGLNYITGRYGSPCSALAHSNSVGWY